MRIFRKTEEVTKPITQKFVIDLADGSDILKNAAKETLTTTAEVQGYKLGDFQIESGFDVRNNRMNYQMSAIGTKQ